MRKIFLALDNMYGQLIALKELEAYLSVPPIFFQDGFFSGNSKFGERGAYKISHRPFSIICSEQKTDLDLTVIQITNQNILQTQNKHLTGLARNSIFLVSSDSFENIDWKTLLAGKDLEIHYSTRSRFKNFYSEESDFEDAGGIAFTGHPVAVQLEINDSSMCWPDMNSCELFVRLKDKDGAVIKSRIVMLDKKMFVEEAVLEFHLILPSSYPTTGDLEAPASMPS
jgi:hypothetical protein